MIRAALQSDTDAIATILSDWIDQTLWMPRLHTRSEDRWFCNNLISETEVFVFDDPALGFIARDGSDVPALYVGRDARRRGVGTAFLKKVKAQSEVLTLWCFQSNKGALAFYRLAGFEEVTRTDGQSNEENLPDIQLRWKRRSV